MSQLVLSVDDYLQQSAAYTWIIESILPVGGKLLLYGDPKVGKSFHALSLARAIAGLEKEWLGFPVTHPGPVVYLQLDTPRSLWQERLAKIRGQGHLFDGVYIADRETLKAWPFDILHLDHSTLLREIVAHYKPVCVVIDVIREIHSMKESSNDEMPIVMKAIEAATHPCALVFLTHAKKPMPEGEPDLINDIRGASYFAGSVDTIMRATERGVYYTGRAIEGGVVWCERTSNGLWRPCGQPE